MPLGRRTLIAGASSAAFTPLAVSAPSWASSTSRTSMTLHWLGTTGWVVRTDGTTILVDPYMTRFDVGLAAGRFDADTPLRSDPDAVRDGLERAGVDLADVDAVLVTHTHWDHFADVPEIARASGASVFTTLTGYLLARSLDVPANRLAVVKGGEHLRVGDVVVEVARSLHSRTGSGGLLFPGLHTTVPPRPRTISELPEGDTLAYKVTGPGGGSGLLLGASDFDERALQGLAPDVVAVPVPMNDVTADYVPRLLAALDRPRQIVPVHWDDFESPLANPPQAPAAWRTRRDELAAEVHTASPSTRVVDLDYFTPLPI